MLLCDNVEDYPGLGVDAGLCCKFFKPPGFDCTDKKCLSNGFSYFSYIFD